MSREQSVDSSPVSDDDSPTGQNLLSQPHHQARGTQGSGNRAKPRYDAHRTASPHTSPMAPMPKRRRVTRACDECRKKKIKCDGKQPCTHCQVYTYDCTYDQPSNRRRNPDPQHVEALETRLRRAKKLLDNYVGDVNLDDPSLDEQTSPLTGPRGRQTSASSILTGQDSMLETMVENTGSLDLDDDGFWDFSGHSSGRAFLRHLRAQFGQVVGTSERNHINVLSAKAASLGSPSSGLASGDVAPTRRQLPPRRCARVMCECAFEDVCAVLRPVHEPSFYVMFDRIYDTTQSDFDAEEKKFIPLFYAVIALGALFSKEEQSLLMTSGFENAIDQGSKWYQISRSMTDVTDVRDMVSLQTVLFMVLFLQCSANLSSCYAHIGICLSSALRMGLHRSVDHAFDPIEQETRKRIFWCIVKLDVYVGALLGLPRMLSKEDIDQEEPLEVDDEFITSTEIKPMPRGYVPLMSGFNAHSRIVNILSKVVKYVYPIKNHRPAKSHTYIVSHTRIREIEHDLQKWMEDLPRPFRPGVDAPRQYVRMQHILRMAYAHIEMFLYRPFLHYVSRDLAPSKFDERSYTCAAACVNVSRNIIRLTDVMNKQQMLSGSYWFYMYTTFFAILSLLFYVLENPGSTSSVEIFREIHSGRSTLADLAHKSLAANKCTKYLKDLFIQLSDRLEEAAATAKQGDTKQHDALPSPSTVSKSRIGAGEPEPSQRIPKQHAVTPRMDQQIREQGNRAGLTLGPNPHMPFRPPNMDYSQDTQGTPWSTTLPDQGVHDLGNVMFPSRDPFAYPIQPMITLESRQQFRLPDTSPEQYYPQSSDAVQAQTYGPPISDFGMLAPEDSQHAYLQTQPEAMMTPNAVHMAQGGMTWQEQQQQQQQPPQDQASRPPQSYDNLFGEDWSGWGR